MSYRNPRHHKRKKTGESLTIRRYGDAQFARSRSHRGFHHRGARRDASLAQRKRSTNHALISLGCDTGAPARGMGRKQRVRARRRARSWCSRREPRQGGLQRSRPGGAPGPEGTPAEGLRLDAGAHLQMDPLTRRASRSPRAPNSSPGWTEASETEAIRAHERRAPEQYWSAQ